MNKLSRKLERAGERSRVISAEIYFAGVLAVFQNEKLHKFLSGVMVWFTAISLTSIAENKLYQIEFPYPFILPLGLLGLFVWFYYFSDYAEEGKISLIRTSLFSSGLNRFISLVYSFIVILLLVSINYFGVLAAGEVSKRYLDKKLLESEEIVLQKNNLDLISKSIGQGDFKSQEEFISDMREQKRSLRKSLNDFVSTKNKKRYATQILNKTKEINKEINKIDWKISQAIKSLNEQRLELNKHNATILNQSNEMVSNIKKDLKEGRDKNSQTVENEKSWAKFIAIGGEILDGLFILGYLLLHKTNPSSDYISTLKKGARKEEKIIDTFEELAKPKLDTVSKSDPFKRSLNASNKSVTLSDKKYSEIKEVADTYQEDFTHISQRDLIAHFKRIGKSLNPKQVQIYFSRRAKEGEIYRPSKNGRYEYQAELVSA